MGRQSSTIYAHVIHVGALHARGSSQLTPVQATSWLFVHRLCSSHALGAKYIAALPNCIVSSEK